MRSAAHMSRIGRMASVNIAQSTIRTRRGISPGLSFVAGLVLAGIIAGMLI